MTFLWPTVTACLAARGLGVLTSKTKTPSSGWREKLDLETRQRICASCRRLSEWGRIVKLLTTVNEGHWDKGPPEQSTNRWPSAPGWEHLKRGFKHSLTLAPANYLEFFDEDHQIGRFHEDQAKLRDQRFPTMGYPQFKREHVPRKPGVVYMPTPDYPRDVYKVAVHNGRLVLPPEYPSSVKLRLVQHTTQLAEEDEVTRGERHGDKLKHRVIFVADEDEIYVAVKEEGKIQHSSFLGGRPGFLSGYLTLRDYRSDDSFKVTKIKGKSGHYRPDLDQFVVFLWALELLLPLHGIAASYAVVANGTKLMVKADAGQLLDDNRGRVIPTGAPDSLRFQLELTDTPPVAAQRPQSVATEQPPALDAATEPHVRSCGCCNCSLM